MLFEMPVRPVERQHGLSFPGPEKHTVSAVFPEKRSKLVELPCDFAIIGFGLSLCITVFRK